MKMLEAKLTQTPHSKEVQSTAKHHHQYGHNLSITWSQEVHTSKGDGCDGNVAEEEHGVGHAQRGQQQVEHIVHLSAEVEVVENGSQGWKINEKVMLLRFRPTWLSLCCHCLFVFHLSIYNFSHCLSLLLWQCCLDDVVHCHFLVVRLSFHARRPNAVKRLKGSSFLWVIGDDG